MLEKLNFNLLTQEQAIEIADEWKYPKPYNFYDMTADLEDYEELLDPALRKDHYYAVVANEKLIGFFCVFPQESMEQSVEMGLGLKPALTGKGRGEKFVKVVVDYINEQFNHPTIWLSVVEFNQRAMKVYEKNGFKHIDKITQPSNGSTYTFYRMHN
ncbi:GNAT family N-acetyltransferase [Marinilactibacillus kalidii]|uniref:GNAT family N-acetyltransferase n=1 Tax=Marinilactibacillus kalidii TaxID=2820274 RepID=UPI001ABE5A3C|nr:GNAT family N-acetyltransferase [Marinilactibacillus kalidii]